jgi:hypothetical protein
VGELMDALGSEWLVRALFAGLGLPLLVVMYQWAQRAHLFEHEPTDVALSLNDQAHRDRFDVA